MCRIPAHPKLLVWATTPAGRAAWAQIARVVDRRPSYNWMHAITATYTPSALPWHTSRSPSAATLPPLASPAATDRAADRRLSCLPSPYRTAWTDTSPWTFDDALESADVAALHRMEESRLGRRQAAEAERAATPNVITQLPRSGGSWMRVSRDGGI